MMYSANVPAGDHDIFLLLLKMRQKPSTDHPVNLDVPCPSMVRDFMDRNVTMMEIDNNLLMARLQDRQRDEGDGVSCKHPVLDIFDKAIMKFFPPSPKLDCASKPPWVHLRGDKIVVDQNLVRERSIRCDFAEVLRATDDLNRRGPTYSTDKEHKFRLSDFVEASCTDRHGNKWESVIAGGWRNEKVVSTTGWQLLSPDGLPVNVLIWGQDSISRNTFVRKLPKTYEFLMKALGGIVLKGYNIVGDGTLQAIIPLMTGKTEIELPDARKRMGDAASSVDKLWLFDDASCSGLSEGILLKGKSCKVEQEHKVQEQMTTQESLQVSTSVTKVEEVAVSTKGLRELAVTSLVALTTISTLTSISLTTRAAFCWDFDFSDSLCLLYEELVCGMFLLDQSLVGIFSSYSSE
ncbi:unnamed protein product, partial [Notodromas monacha]